MPQIYEPEFKKKLSAFIQKKDSSTKASLLNMEYPKPVSPSGAENLTKNAKPKPWKTQTHLMKWSL